MGTLYNHHDIEDKWYQFWLDNNIFGSVPNEKEPFTIVIPPPNVTGVLHMGHVLNETIQDILIRRARMEGKNSCWVPGTDHASIATEAKIIKLLKSKGINKQDLTREQFLQYAWEWKEKHGSIILQQLKKLGCSCDWNRTAFTMDEIRSKAVIHVFCDLYEKGLIYRGLRMVNWDPERQTALSDEEVIYKEEHSHLYYLKYRVIGDPTQDISQDSVFHKDTKGYYALVATTRPETIMGDVAVCINPKDKKNTWLKNKKLIVPLVNRQIPVIEDRYVDIDFGTGCLKVTPAHDINDYALGQKHNLKIIDIFTPDAHISKEANMYIGMDRFECRKQIVADLQKADLLEKIEDYTNNVGYSERTNVPIEPRLSLQWFVKMQHFADIALKPVINNEIKFYPTKYKNTYRNWLENIKDWCISRQLWWGHRIPAYFLPNQENIPEEDKLFVVAPTKEKALEKAQTLLLQQNRKEEVTTLKKEDLIQDEAALDTWFSSWLWPISLFDGIEHPDNNEINYYYPTADLVTGPDIIFFWVARMIMAGYEYMGNKPFKNVYFTGIVRDKLGRKMSKSLGNSPDPLDLIEKYGADGVRMGMMLCAPAGNDILFDENLCEQGRNFCNKIWNCSRLLAKWQKTDKETPQENKVACQWMQNTLTKIERDIDDLFKKYKLNEALMTIYKLFWDTFSGWFLEMIKPKLNNELDNYTYDLTWQIWKRMLQLLHPFMPFITEELWHDSYPATNSITISSLHKNNTPTIKFDNTSMTLIQNIVSAVRNIRTKNNIPNKNTIPLYIFDPQTYDNIHIDYLTLLKKLCNIEKIITTQEKPDNVVSFVIGTSEFGVPLSSYIDKSEEKKRLEAELEHQIKFLNSVKAKLNNERFLQNANKKIVEYERKKQHDAQARIDIIQQALKDLT